MSQSVSDAAIILEIDRAAGELRRGGMVALLKDGRACALVLAAEHVSDTTLATLRGQANGDPALAVSARRAEALGLGDGLTARLLRKADQAEAADFAALCDPLLLASTEGWSAEIAGAAANAAITLVKLAGLLPMVLLADFAGETCDLVTVESGLVLDYPDRAARSLTRVAEVDLPLAAAEQCHVVAYRPADGGAEHLALIVGKPDLNQPVLIRLHSACFTGDLLGSLRCDCGEQLQGAIARLAEAGGGVLLYLAQEGRGIGLVNKLRAYRLQDQGLDTLDANRQLGFEDDERLYLAAVQMLADLKIAEVRLLTNNPSKVEALSRHGIIVVERMPHAFPANPHNRRYLATKAARSGHLF